MTPFYNDKKGFLSVTLQVQPRARKSEIVGVHGAALKVKIAASPVDGEANEELIRFFSKFFGVPKSSINLKQGAASRHKVLEIEGVSASEFTQILLKQGYLTISLA
jgi:uncharacterized protein (TIGR00251 family)